MVSPEVTVEAGPLDPVQEARRARCAGYIVFAFAIVLVLVLAYLMREILLLLYVSALFAVVLQPRDPRHYAAPHQALASRQAGWRSFSCC